jgi:hypothetical protein
VEGRLEFGAVVCLDDLHWEGQPLEHIVNELDRGFLVAAWVDAQHTQPGAVVDRSELVVLGAAAGRAAAFSGSTNLTSIWTW